MLLQRAINILYLKRCTEYFSSSSKNISRNLIRNIYNVYTIHRNKCLCCSEDLNYVMKSFDKVRTKMFYLGLFFQTLFWVPIWNGPFSLLGRRLAFHGMFLSHICYMLKLLLVQDRGSLILWWWQRTFFLRPKITFLSFWLKWSLHLHGAVISE